MLKLSVFSLTVACVTAPYYNTNRNQLREFITCFSNLAARCAIQKFQENICSAKHPRWKIERVSRKGCKKYGVRFYTFKGYGIKQHNTKPIRSSRGVCKHRCVVEKTFVCKAIDYVPKLRASENCLLSSEGYMDVTPGEREQHLRWWQLLVRKCRHY